MNDFLSWFASTLTVASYFVVIFITAFLIVIYSILTLSLVTNHDYSLKYEEAKKAQKPYLVWLGLMWLGLCIFNFANKSYVLFILELICSLIYLGFWAYLKSIVNKGE